MKAHKYLKPLIVISAARLTNNMIENPGFFTVTSRDIWEMFHRIREIQQKDD
jgi:hypothetical protein